MLKLEDIQPNCSVRGVLGSEVVTVVSVTPYGDDALGLAYRTCEGNIGECIIFRSQERDLELAEEKRASFSADAEELKLVSEAYRISLANLFDPYLAVRTSNVQPLPHQITAVYQDMLPRLPLRYVLADDPGAGKTIMTGLLIKEMMARGDLKRCLIVCPGSLCEQWQDELLSKFNLRFEILTNDRLEAAATRNAFEEVPCAIARLDKLARDEEAQAKLANTQWDLIVCDEAHKMSASLSGGEVKKTKRYHLGELLGKLTENILLLTATPHNGKPGDFQLFMSLIDPDRFEGAKRAADEDIDVSDCMRRLVKEELLTFEGKPLFPERRAYTVNYELSPEEMELYQQVTEYVKGEFNRADRLDGKRKHSVGFALTMLQRRLASSPEAIYQSLHRRRERLSERLAELKSGRPGFYWPGVRKFDDSWRAIESDNFDEDELSWEELEELESDVTDTASAAATTQELEAEIESLSRLERMADSVRKSGKDRKWEELSSLLQGEANVFGNEGRCEKLIVFTEHKDTLWYLKEKIVSLLGDEEAVLTIRGGMSRDARRAAEQAFKQDPRVRILIATDAAGEGINLQRAHLMVNYDLPWNPNRIEQRFGRIHRIGQTEVCHLWNLVSAQTREGEVFQRLFSKLEEERRALGGRVFDILGRLTFDDAPLKDLLLDAIRYGDDPQVRARLNSVVDASFDSESIKRLLSDYALSEDTMTLADVMSVKRDMERMEACKLEPHFICSFFLAAMKELGGNVREREKGRYEVLRVPAEVRNKGAQLFNSNAVLKHYERVCFERELEHVDGSPVADVLYPSHPLLCATTACIIDAHRSALSEGSIFIDDADWDDVPRLLFYVETVIRDGVVDGVGSQRTISKELRFIELKPDGSGGSAGFAPYLDYRAPNEDEAASLRAWLPSSPFAGDAEQLAMGYAIRDVVPEHLERISKRRTSHIEKVKDAVSKRMKAEIRYWDGRAWELAEREHEGKSNARLNADNARQRADELNNRMQARLAHIEQEEHLSAATPRIMGCSLVIPRGLMAELAGAPIDRRALSGRQAVEAAAMDAVMRIERKLGNVPTDVSAQNVGYDVESVTGPSRGAGPVLRFIEVKGRIAGSTTVTVSRNEVLCALNKPEGFLLAVVDVTFDEGGHAAKTHTTYFKRPFTNQLDAAANCAVYELADLRRDAEVVYEEEETR